MRSNGRWALAATVQVFDKLPVMKLLAVVQSAASVAANKSFRNLLMRLIAVAIGNCTHCCAYNVTMSSTLVAISVTLISFVPPVVFAPVRESKNTYFEPLL